MPDLPIGGFLLIGIIGGGLAIQQGGFDLTSPVTLFGIGLLLVGIVVLGLAYRVYASEGLGAAVDYLVTVEDDENAESSQSQTGQKPKRRHPRQRA